MAKRGRKGRFVKKPPLQPSPDPSAPSCSKEEKEFREKQHAFNDCEVKRRITAIHAINNAEVENLLSRLRLLRSYFTNEQLQTPVIQFFNENCPNLLVVRNEKYPFFELDWKDKGIGFPMSIGGWRGAPASVRIRSSGDLSFSTRSVKTNMLTAASLHIPDSVFGEPSGTHFSGLIDSLQTPGKFNCYRLLVIAYQ